jgi:hypothetical protein
LLISVDVKELASRAGSPQSTPQACVPIVMAVTFLRKFPLFYDKPMTIENSIFLE